jgi:UDP-glucuronate decarboxylase
VRSIKIDYPKNYPQVEPLRRCPDISKIKKELNFKIRVSIDESIKRFYNWSKLHY